MHRQTLNVLFVKNRALSVRLAMSNLPWKPLRIEFDVDRQIDDLFQRVIHSQWGSGALANTWQPEIDVYETRDEYLVEADVPGVTSDELQIEITDHWLTISGSRECTGIVQSAQKVRLERRHGSFSRRFYLNHAVDLNHVDHACAEGLHRIRLRKLD